MNEGSGPQRVVIGASGGVADEPASPWARRDGDVADDPAFSYPPPTEATRAPAPAPPPRPPSPDDVWRRDAAPPAGSTTSPPPSSRPTYTYDDLSPDDPEPDDPGPAAATGDARPPADRARWITIGVAAALVALVAGWALGRGGDGVAETVDSSPVTTRGPNTTIAQSVLPGDTLPAASVPTTTRPRPTTTTTTTLPPVWQDSTTGIDPRLAGSTDRLVVATVDSLIEVDLATGATRTFPTRSGLLRQTVVGVVAGPDWLVVTPENGNAPQVLLDATDGAPTSTPVEGADPWAFLWDTGTDRFWVMEYDHDDGSAQGVRLYDVRTGEQGELVDTHGLWASRGDPAGGVIVGDQTIGVYTLSADGSRRLAGYPVALGVSHYVTYRCGESIDECGYLLVERATGDERPVPVDATAEGDLGGDWWSPPNPMPQVTADGRFAVVTMRTEQIPVPALLDTETGAVVLFAGDRTSNAFGVVQPVFSGDDRFAFVVIDGVLVAHELSTGEQFPVAPSGGPLSAVRVVTIRPAAG